MPDPEHVLRAADAWACGDPDKQKICLIPPAHPRSRGWGMGGGQGLPVA